MHSRNSLVFRSAGTPTYEPYIEYALKDHNRIFSNYLLDK